jgi:hypothetical protein
MVGLCLLVCARAQADEPLPLELEWDVPGECPPAASVLAELERIAHGRPGMVLPPLKARAQVVANGPSYRLTLQTLQDGRRGERRFEAADCLTLLRTVTLVLALSFGAGVELTGAEPETTGKASDSSGQPQSRAAAALPAVVRPAQDAQTVAAAQGRAASSRGKLVHGWALFMGGGAQLALLRGAALSISAGSELDLGRFVLEARISGLMAREQRYRSQVDTDFDALLARLASCAEPALGPLSVGLCGEGRFGMLRGSSSGAAEGSQAAPWYALAGRLALTWPSAYWLRLRLEAALAVSLNRPRFVVEGLGDVHRVPRLAPDVGLLLLVSP